MIISLNLSEPFTEMMIGRLARSGCEAGCVAHNFSFQLAAFDISMTHFLIDHLLLSVPFRYTVEDLSSSKGTSE